MQIREILLNEFNNDASCIYNSSDFHKINSNKVNDVRALSFIDNDKTVLNLTIGIADNTIKIPYSAPFGFFEMSGKSVSHRCIDEALNLLDEYAVSHGVQEIFFRIPPKIYYPKYIDKVINSFFRQGYEVDCCDINYAIPTRGMEVYESSLKRNAKKNLKRALSSGFSFWQCSSEDDKRKAYNVIKENRRRKGYPLWMSYEQVKEMETLADTDYFLLTHDENSVASAIVFSVTYNIRQVVYWGDVAGYDSMRPMNMLSYKVVEYYHQNSEINYLDIGPSTEHGVPNYGLCDFKESIGCTIGNKYTFVKKMV